MASLRNQPFNEPSYVFHDARIPAGAWREVFNSDAAAFGGDDVGTDGATLQTVGGRLECVVPANGVLVWQRA